MTKKSPEKKESVKNEDVKKTATAEPRAEYTESDVADDPLVKKLLDVASQKPFVSWEEITDVLTQDFVNSPKMEPVLSILQKNNIQILSEDEPFDEDEDDENLDDDDEESAGIAEELKDEDSGKHRLVANDKDSSIDDPIRLYLREIGKENLLTAEQEVSLSKKMEDGQNIIKNVIKNSGMMVPEFYKIGLKIFKRFDQHEPGKARKEINEEMAERRRLRSAYLECMKPVKEQMSEYIALKKKLHGDDPTVNIFKDVQLQNLRTVILASFENMDIKTEEIEYFSSKFIEASKKINEYHLVQEKRMKKLHITDAAGLRGIGRRLAMHKECVKLENELGLTADEIRTD